MLIADQFAASRARYLNLGYPKECNLDANASRLALAVPEPHCEIARQHAESDAKRLSKLTKVLLSKDAFMSSPTKAAAGYQITLPNAASIYTQDGDDDISIGPRMSKLVCAHQARLTVHPPQTMFTTQRLQPSCCRASMCA